MQSNDYAAALSAAVAYSAMLFLAGLPPQSFVAQPSSPQAHLHLPSAVMVMAAQVVAAQHSLMPMMPCKRLK